MKINLVIDSASRAAGGLYEAERRLWQTLNRDGVTVSLFALADEFSAEDAMGWRPVAPAAFPVSWPKALGRSRQLCSRLLAEPADLLYRAGLWKWPSSYALTWSRKFKKPEMIAPHGMLDPWAVKNSAWKKRLVLALYEREHLNRAACIRALCESEARAIRQAGLKNPIAIIPNGIDLPELQTPNSELRTPPPWDGWIESGRKVLLFLSRIHPKKGLVNLLTAWSQIRNSELGTRNSDGWGLAIAGWDQGGHETELKALATDLRISWADVRERGTGSGERRAKPQAPSSLLFLGPQFGEAKANCYRNCDAFILPSFSEGLPMVILEAWAYGKPVLMTPECNLPEGFSTNAALRIEPSAGSIAQGLRELFQAPSSKLQALGANGRNLVANKFIWAKVAADMKAVYEWVLGGGPMPECVQIKS